ncbi:MAG: hypothetical protein JW910_15450 [Anaerolineae bacterium]|nr:hypothetical protein [Anaerolineae bacterium]
MTSTDPVESARQRLAADTSTPSTPPADPASPQQRRRYLAPPEVSSRLSRAEELLRRKNKAAARAILDEVAPYAVKNARYWKLVAWTAANRPDALDAVQRALKLRPQDQQAWQMLRKLDQRAVRDLQRQQRGLSPQPRRSLRERVGWTNRALLFALIAAVIVTLVVLVAIYGNFTL